MTPRQSKKPRLAFPAPLADSSIPRGVEKCKAVALPAEILLEIISYYPNLPMDNPPERFPMNRRYLDASAFERSDTIRALSQTCLKWRAFFWHMLWERVEAGALKGRTGAQWYHKLTDTLIRKCNGIASNPDIANKVRQMRIVIPGLGMFDALQSLVRCLNACPNLKTLHIYFTHPGINGTLKDVFSTHSFPSIRTVILPTEAHHILRSCPNAKTVHCNLGDRDGSQIISAIAAKCKGVQVLTGISPHLLMMKRIVKAAPNLRELCFYNSPKNDALALLSKLKHLRLIELETHIVCEDDVEKDMPTESALRLLKGILKSKAGGTIIIRPHCSQYHSGNQSWTKTISL